MTLHQTGQLSLRPSADRTNTGLTKIEQYKWNVLDKPGVFLEIPKAELIVDHEYQRPLIEDKALTIARAWSWVACGVLTVADRDARFWVMDGQHRTDGAMRRADIDKLPCMVFETRGPRDEAKGFLATNTLRKPATAAQKFKAEVVAGNAQALKLNTLINSEGRVVSEAEVKSGIRCISTLLKLMATDEAALRRIFPLVCALSERTIDRAILEGFFWLERNLPAGQSVSERRWTERAMAVGAAVLSDTINRAVALDGAGPKIYAAGILRALNRGLRNKLVLNGSED